MGVADEMSDDEQREFEAVLHASFLMGGVEAMDVVAQSQPRPEVDAVEAVRSLLSDPRGRREAIKARVDEMVKDVFNNTRASTVLIDDAVDFLRRRVREYLDGLGHAALDVVVVGSYGLRFDDQALEDAVAHYRQRGSLPRPPKRVVGNGVLR